MRDATVICPHCFAANEERTAFCRQCGTPLTSYAEIDPLGQIRATGDTYLKAIHSPRKPIILLGMWLLFGPSALGGLIVFIRFIVLTATKTEDVRIGGGFFGGLFLACYGAGWAVLGTIVLFKTTRNYRRSRLLTSEEATTEM